MYRQKSKCFPHYDKIPLLKPLILHKIIAYDSLKRWDDITCNIITTSDFNNFMIDDLSFHYKDIASDTSKIIMEKKLIVKSIYNHDLYKHFLLKQLLINDIVGLISINLRLLTTIEPYIKYIPLPEN